MKAKIEIECETYEEFFQHMAQIKKDLKRKFDQNSITPIKIEDNNCYGFHEVIITDEV